METQPAPGDAEAALALVAGSRAALADRLVTPGWYHPALGALTGGLVASYAAGSLRVTVVALALFGLGVALLVRRYRALTGVWVNGLRAGRASRWAVALAAVTGLAVLVGTGLQAWLGWWAAPLVAGLAVWAATVVLGNRFDDALRAELRSR